MNLFSTLADYKYAVINTSCRNASLLDITLFKNYDKGRKFMRESAREIQLLHRDGLVVNGKWQEVGKELHIDDDGCSVYVSDEDGKYMRWTIYLTKNLLMRVNTYNN